MHDRKRPIDGVVQRRVRRNIDDFSRPRLNADPFAARRADTRRNERAGAPVTPTRTHAANHAKRASDIWDRPSASGPTGNSFQSGRAQRRIKRAKKVRLRRVLRRFALASGAVAVLAVAFVGIKSFLTLQKVIDRNGDGALALLDGVDPSMLNGEGDGRVNIMLLGTGGDDHPGGDLADSIIVASIDPRASEVAMLSVPRDLYVDVPGYWSTRINAAHAMGEDQGHPGGGVALMQETLEEILDIPIHYYVKVDFEGFKQAVDALGGVTVNVTNPVINDYQYAWEIGGPFNVPEGVHTFDGQEALYYVRSRYTSPRGDFDRNQRQRDFLAAMKDKALSSETATNPARISQLMDALGGHVRTNIQISEMMRMAEIGRQVSNNKIIGAGLEDYIGGANIDGAAVQVPNAGDFSEIQTYVRRLFVDGFIRSELAPVIVLNGSGITGKASETSDLLKSYGYNVTQVDNAPVSDVLQTRVFAPSEDRWPYTLAYLKQRFGATIEGTDALPFPLQQGQEDAIIILLGSNDSQSEQETGY